MRSATDDSGVVLLNETHVGPLLKHLDTEESLLHRARAALLQTGSLPDTNDAHQKHRSTIDAMSLQIAEASVRRLNLLRQYARALQVPEERLTLGVIIRLCDPDAARTLSEAQRRLRRLVREVQVLSHTASWILQQSRRVNLMVLESLSDQPSSDRYDAHGHRAFGQPAVKPESRA